MNWARTGNSRGNWECRKPWVAKDEEPILGSPGDLNSPGKGPPNIAGSNRVLGFRV